MKIFALTYHPTLQSKVMVLNQTKETIYEGFLGDEADSISAVVIDEPADKSRLVSIFWQIAMIRFVRFHQRIRLSIFRLSIYIDQVS